MMVDAAGYDDGKKKKKNIVLTEDNAEAIAGYLNNMI